MKEDEKEIKKEKEKSLMPLIKTANRPIDVLERKWRLSFLQAKRWVFDFKDTLHGSFHTKSILFCF